MCVNSGCNDPISNPEPNIENPYSWQVDLPWTQEHPYYSDGHYYLFPIFEKSSN